MDKILNSDGDGIEKIKSFGFFYLAICAKNIEESGNDFNESFCVKKCVDFAAKCFENVKSIQMQNDLLITLNAGISVGEFFGCILGKIKPLFDVFGAEVNQASRICVMADDYKIEVSPSATECLSSFQRKDSYYPPYKTSFQNRNFKGIGEVRVLSIEL